jgi:ubiquinone/menaquinone biosynthesis C-methylase UbiE
LLDYTQAQLDSDAMVAQSAKATRLKTVKADMSKPLPFPDDCFDLIFFPVSNVYIEEAKPVFKECYRILRKAGTACFPGLDNASISSRPMMKKRDQVLVSFQSFKESGSDGRTPKSER